jgi:hypothetical protein
LVGSFGLADRPFTGPFPVGDHLVGGCPWSRWFVFLQLSFIHYFAPLLLEEMGAIVQFLVLFIFFVV